MKYFILTLTILFSFPAFSEEGNFSLVRFRQIDTADDIYLAAIEAPENKTEELCKLLKGKNENQSISIDIGETKTRIIKDSIRRSGNFYFFYLDSRTPVLETEQNISLYLTSKNGVRTLSNQIKTTISKKNGLAEQPIILSVKPGGAAPEETIKIIGRNFGPNISNIGVYFYDMDNTESLYKADLEANIQSCKDNKFSDCDCEMGAAKDLPREYRSIIPGGMDIKGIYLSPFLDKSGIADATGLMELQIPMPYGRRFTEYAKKSFLRNIIKVRIFVEGRPSGFYEMALLSPNWNLIVVILTLIATVCGWGIFAFIIGKWDFWDVILIDPNTNKYNLERFQAFAWTLVLLSSYFYVAISFGVVQAGGSMPTFNPSLIALMGISYGGLIGANYVGRKNPSNQLISTPPSFKDLFMENEALDIARMQLLAFTVVSVIIYLYNLALSNPLNGLPELPPSLHALLVTSNGGYIGAKAMAEPISVTNITPSQFNVTDPEMRIRMIGSGFIEGIRIMLEGSENEPVKTELKSSTIMECTIANDNIPGVKNLTLIPPIGSTVTIKNAFKIEDTAADSNQENIEKKA